MKTNILLLFTFSFFMILHSTAQTDSPRFIVRGDDMGSSHTANQAIIESYKEGIVTSVEVMVPTPWFPESVKLLKKNPLLDVGAHLTLTSEWENIKWRPLTSCGSLIDSNGNFYPMVMANTNYPGQSLNEVQWKIEEIEKELRAQIELAKRNIPQLSHVSAHMNFTDLGSEVKNLTKRLAKEYNLDIDPENYDVIQLGYGGPSGTFKEKKSGFIRMLESMKPGKTYLFVDHPGYDNDELKAEYHIGYENVSADRQGVTDLFTNKSVKKKIRELKIKLIGYNELKKNNHSERSK